MLDTYYDSRVNGHELSFDSEELGCCVFKSLLSILRVIIQHIMSMNRILKPVLHQYKLYMSSTVLNIIKVMMYVHFLIITNHFKFKIFC